MTHLSVGMNLNLSDVVVVVGLFYLCVGEVKGEAHRTEFHLVALQVGIYVKEIPIVTYTLL